MPEPEPTALYRLYDADSGLLYIGISYQPDKRFEEHATNRSWWHLVTRKEVAWLASREAALLAEAAATETEKPAYDGAARIKNPQLPRRDYDDSADRASAERQIRAAVADGSMPPGSFHWPKRVAERCGCSMRTASSVMWSLTMEGVLELRGKGYGVPTGQGEQRRTRANQDTVRPKWMETGLHDPD